LADYLGVDVTDLTDEAGSVFERALDAASEAFAKVIDSHFGRTFDCTPEDEQRLLAEYQASSELLRGGAAVHLRTGLVDADFVCWHSALADENFGPSSDGQDTLGRGDGVDARVV
jgi:hypothetical protein